MSDLVSPGIAKTSSSTADESTLRTIRWFRASTSKSSSIEASNYWLPTFGAAGIGADRICTHRALPALDAAPAPQRERECEEQPQDRRVEDRVDREAGPDW